MSKNIIFLVHGVGRHGEGWAFGEGGPVKALTDAANRYDGFSVEDPLTNSIEFVEIRYDDIFDRILSRWAELADGLANLPEAAPEAIAAVGQRLTEVDDPDNWYAAQAMDVGFYKAFKLVRRLVQLRVASRIMKTISENTGSDTKRYGVIAHSLGTTVAHDAIHRMGTTAWLSNAEEALNALNESRVEDPVEPAEMEAAIRRFGRKPFSPGRFRFDAVFMISNTSRLLHRDTPTPGDSIVRPSFSKPESSPKNACSRFFNVDHVLDPVSKIRRFRAEEVWPHSASRKNAKDLFNIKHVHDVNVHSLSHYLTHPLVHREIFSTFAPHRFSFDDFMWAKERASAGGDFPQWGERYLDEDKQEKLRAAYGRFHLDPEHQEYGALLLAMPKLFEDLKALFESVGPGA
ncbi:MAG: hypothetical protein U9R74_08375 [Pseudomonadota bacterium]|nr:hypothetical protein [Pseudomonadota bacterium]